MTQFSTNSDFATDAAGTVATGNNVATITGWEVINPLGGSGGANSVYTLTTDANMAGGQYVAARETGWDVAAHFLKFLAAGTIATATELDVLFQARLPALPGVDTLVGKILYSGGNYYGIRIFNNGSAQLYRFQNTSAWSGVGSAVSLPDITAGGPAALVANGIYWWRIHKTAAGVWSWKIWTGLVGDQPAGWTVGDGGAGGASNTEHTSGDLGVGMLKVNDAIDYGWFSAATAGDTAPEPGGGAPSITNVDGDDTVFEGQTSVQVNYTGGDASGNVVTISPTDNVADGAAVTPTISAENATQITLSVVNFPTGVAEGGTAYVFVTSTGGTNASGHAITRLDITAPLLSSGTATGVTPNAATPQVTTNEAAGQAWHVIVPSAESTPSGTQIKAGQNAAGGSPVASGTVNPVSGTTVTFAEVTGLSPSTSYKICFYQEDAATPTPNGSNVTTHTFSTAALPSITTQALRQNNGTLLASQTGITADVYNTSTGALVVRKTGLSSDGSGVVTFSDAALSAATEYKVTLEYDTGGGVMADGVARITTA